MKFLFSFHIRKTNLEEKNEIKNCMGSFKISQYMNLCIIIKIFNSYLNFEKIGNMLLKKFPDFNS